MGYKSALGLVLVTVLTIALIQYGRVEEGEREIRLRFEGWKKEFGMGFEAVEEIYRLAVFERNL